jgi:phage baseplate assembly protein W
MSNKSAVDDILEKGLIAPIIRDGTDFSVARGATLIKSRIMQILGTSPGELPWDPDFGAMLDAVRHKNMNALLPEEVYDYIRDALARYEPEVTVADISIGIEDTNLRISLRWYVSTTAKRGSNQLIGLQNTELVV